MTIKDGLRAVPRGESAAPPYTKPAYTWDSELSFTGKPLRNATGRVYYEEFFNQPPAINTDIGVATNLDYEVLGTNMTSALVTYSTTSAGIVMTTAGADNDQGILTPHLDTKQTALAGTLWGTENQVVWEAAITVGDDIATGLLLWAGLKLTNTPTIATDDDQVFFRFSTDDSDTNWEIVYSIGGTDTTVDSGVAVAANTQVKFRIDIDSDRKAHFYINDVEITKSTALTNDVDLIPYIGIQALSGTAEFVTVHYEKISRILYE